jgi:hypothetical protein
MAEAPEALEIVHRLPHHARERRPAHDPEYDDAQRSIRPAHAVARVHGLCRMEQGKDGAVPAPQGFWTRSPRRWVMNPRAGCPTDERSSNDRDRPTVD